MKDYYKKVRVAHSGKQFVKDIIEHIQTLADNPDIGRVVPKFAEDQIRELIHSPFRIVYLREPNLIHIIRVWRSERILRLEGEIRSSPSQT
ncbi:MAG: type II toxin-antitoxin system RelE/ParE family toxin [Cycloclasticus sp.]|nr:type II toxin-antitoxin system RelE/ParE family toxin [Cycloclasticus sp.]